MHLSSMATQRNGGEVVGVVVHILCFHIFVFLVNMKDNSEPMRNVMHGNWRASWIQVVCQLLVSWCCRVNSNERRLQELN